MVRKVILFPAFVILSLFCHSQDIQYARMVVDTLCAPSMKGRGYAGRGDSLAAAFIAGEYSKIRLKPFAGSYFQDFPISVNTFPGKMDFRIGRNLLVPGKDYLIVASSEGTMGKFRTVKLGEEIFKSRESFTKFMKKDLKNKFLVIDEESITDPQFRSMMDSLKLSNLFSAKGAIFITGKKLMWRVSNAQFQGDYTVLEVLNRNLPQKFRKVQLDIENRFFDRYVTQNVIGYIEGSVRPDSFLVFTAHYDHLGQMGAQTFFPGAHDNASGVSMVLDLARYFSQPEHCPSYSIVFMCFSAEELGLLGSGYYVDSPLFPLSKIRFLINLDLVGSGSEGIKVVNGTVFDTVYHKLVRLNEVNHYLPGVSKRGPAANSDHYHFFEKGVPSFYIYTLGEECREYHTTGDTPDQLPFTRYNELFRLLKDFALSY